MLLGNLILGARDEIVCTVVSLLWTDLPAKSSTHPQQLIQNLDGDDGDSASATIASSPL